ncbi:hypothetical protein [Pseudobacteriovorax antillogorgiicola]|nr:hypothetical protein [Pseudobacteriovorax antillogorgiicola]
MAATRLRSRLSFAILLGLSLSSCLTSLDEEVEINPSIAEDIRYDDVYHEATNQYEVIENFETKYVIHATHLSADFRQAIADRHKTLFEDPTPILSEASAKTGFFISLYVANDEREDLRDQNLWNIILKEGDQSYSPVLVKKLSRKERWKAYFPAVNLWTQEYLVIFDSPAGGSSTQQLVNQSAKVLLITNPDAKVRMSWNDAQE